MDIKQYDKVVGRLAGEFIKTGLEPQLYFPWSILRMNQMYQLPVNNWPTLDNLYRPDGSAEPALNRVTKFLGVLNDEISEGHEIRFILHLVQQQKTSEPLPLNLDDLTAEQVMTFAFDFGLLPDTRISKLADSVVAALADPVYGETKTERLSNFALTAMADWFGDMVVYIRSEALKFGLPLESALACIMGSNFTKLDENDQPITDQATGKVQKGPNFEPPERHIAATMFGTDDLLDQYQDKVDEQARLEAVTGEFLADPMAAVIAAEEEAQSVYVQDAGDEGEAADEQFAMRG